MSYIWYTSVSYALIHQLQVAAEGGWSCNDADGGCPSLLHMQHPCPGRQHLGGEHEKLKVPCNGHLLHEFNYGNPNYSHKVLGINILALNNISNLLVTLNSSVNFIIYCIFGDKFKRIFLRLFCSQGSQMTNMKLKSHCK